MHIIALLLLTIVILALIMLASIWQMNKAAQVMVGKKHHDMENIINTGDVPKDWTKRFERKIARLMKDPGNQTRILELKKAAKESYLRKLDELIAYADKTTLVDSPETRKLLLERLKAVREEWVNKNEREF